MDDGGQQRQHAVQMNRVIIWSLNSSRKSITVSISEINSGSSSIKRRDACGHADFKQTKGRLHSNSSLCIVWHIVNYPLVIININKEEKRNLI